LHAAGAAQQPGIFPFLLQGSITMTTDNLKQSLKNIHEKLAATTDVDPELQAQLHLLEHDIQALLARQTPVAATPESSRLLEQAQSISAKLAARHPNMELALRELTDILGNIGI
jgi:hypothetical protein